MARIVSKRRPRGGKLDATWAGASIMVLALALSASPAVAATPDHPNIIVIMGDDIGWSNLGAYNQGMMLDATPNLDQLAKEGTRLTDYYAEASCTAGRANFIMGELPIRTGMTTVGQAGSQLGFPDAAPRPDRRCSTPSIATSASRSDSVGSAAA